MRELPLVIYSCFEAPYCYHYSNIENLQEFAWWVKEKLVSEIFHAYDYAHDKEYSSYCNQILVFELRKNFFRLAFCFWTVHLPMILTLFRELALVTWINAVQDRVQDPCPVKYQKKIMILPKIKMIMQVLPCLLLKLQRIMKRSNH